MHVAVELIVSPWCMASIELKPTTYVIRKLGTRSSRTGSAANTRHVFKCFPGMKRAGHVRLHSSLQRLQAILCLLALFAGQTGILPACLATATGLEGSHTTSVSMSESGIMIVLSHEQGQPDRPYLLAHHQPTNPAHRHGFAARMLCALGGSTQRTANHVACFSRGGQVEPSGHKVRLVSKLFAEASALRSPQVSSFVSAPCSSLRCPQVRISLPQQAVQETRTTLLLI
jgi:hypothetical protein